MSIYSQFGFRSKRNDALMRIEGTLELEPYKVMFEKDWPRTEGHYEWVATAPVADLLAWVADRQEEARVAWESAEQMRVYAAEWLERVGLPEWAL